ncbi:MAG: S8 family serine peptidase [Desulforhopalus sp.]
MRRLEQFLIFLGVLLLFLFSVTFVTAGEVSPQLQMVLDSSGPEEEIAVIVQLEDKINRKQFKRLKKKLHRFTLLNELKNQAAGNQASLKSFLATSGGRNMRSLWIINGLAIKAKPSVIRKLVKRPEVMAVRLDAPVSQVSDTLAVTSSIPWNITMLDTDLVWAQGFQGQGVVVASMDSGVDYNHTELAGNWRGGTNSWYDPHGQHILPYDADGHGTQSMGIMVGQNLGITTIGMAPQAQWIAVKIFDDNGEALSSDIHAGFQWLLDPDENPATDDAPDVVNNSWGFPETINSCNTEFQPDIQTLRDLGISVVFSAGNQGGASSSISPANNPGAFSVGAVDQAGIITSFSNQGPSACEPGGIYPGVVAPGYLVNTADLTFGGVFPDNFTEVTGTSFAAPHVSGAIALLLSSNPDLTPTDLETAITQSSLDLGVSGGDHVYGYGLVNVADALAFTQCTDIDGDGYFIESSCGTPIDCDDSNPEVYPDATELSHDGIDQNCDGYDLTITIIKALYRMSDDKLLIIATSSLGSDAGLKADIPGIGLISLRWIESKQRWQKAIPEASIMGLQLDSGSFITVTGQEGSVSTPLSITGQCTDADGDGYFFQSTCGTSVDCDDTSSDVYPGAVELWHDGIDQDCDGYDLTINITKALYRTSDDKLLIIATSSLGSDANLKADIPAIGIISLRWNDSKQRWQKAIQDASIKGLQPNSSTIINVFGPEGTVSVTVSIAL